MITRNKTFILCGLLLSSSLFADIDVDTQDIGSENIREPAKMTPYSFDTHADYVANSSIDKGSYKGDKIQFAEAEAELGMVFYFDPENTEALRGAVAFTPTYLRWEGNPWFEQTHFNIFSVSLVGFTKRVDRWFLRGQLTANFDAEKWSSLYTSYDLLLWARYAYSDAIGIHFGCLAQTGLRMDRVYPVLGFDWRISRKWKLSIVYPVNVSLIYALSQKWSLGVAGRAFNSRFRVHQQQHSLKPLVRYTNVGAEFILKFENEYASANIHAGTTIQGKYRVADSKNHHARNYQTNGAAYGGFEIEVKF